MFCPKCRYEYIEGITLCPDCQMPLVQELPEKAAAHHENLVVFRVYHSRHEAEFSKNILDENDVESVIVSEDAGGAGPALAFTRGMVLMVKEEDVERAKEIFEEFEKHTDRWIQEENEEE